VLYLPSLSYTTIYYFCNIFKKSQFLIFIFYVHMHQYLYNTITCKALSCNKSITIYDLTVIMEENWVFNRGERYYMNEHS